MNSRSTVGWFSVKRHARLAVLLGLVPIVLGVAGDNYTQTAMDCTSDPFIVPTLIMAIVTGLLSLGLLVRCIMARKAKAIVLAVLLNILCGIVGLGSTILSVGANLFCGLTF